MKVSITRIAKADFEAFLIRTGSLFASGSATQFSSCGHLLAIQWFIEGEK